MTSPGPVRLSVIIPTRNPHPGRLQRTLAGLAAQSLDPGAFEVILIDNGSTPPVTSAALAAHPATRIVREEQPGLTAARRAGFRESRGEVLVLVDDDNVLAPDYLAIVERGFAADPELGALGGRVTPDFEQPPEPWVMEFYGLLALRDHGALPLRAAWHRGAKERSYPPFAPIGAGFAVRRALALDYSTALDSNAARRALDRTGTRLVSGGDNDLVMHVLEAGASVGYEPGLALTHLIPVQRLQRAYLGALNRAIARSWVSVLALHGIRPWPPVTPWTVRLRQARAWWRTRAWSGPAAWVRWQGRCGTFEGQADLARLPAGVPDGNSPG
ncbi:MAG TPA: glycosyltransferase [Opitutaceae bacterium]|nr:glycosyltransferase [Opitutaceae bacterium]